MSLLSGERRSNRMDIVSRVFPAFRLPGKDLLSVCGWHLRSDTLARVRTRKLVLFTAIVCGLLQTGCSTMGCCLTARVEHESQVEYIVIGFGVIRVAKPDIATAVRASRASILGLGVMGEPGLRIGLGYTEAHVVSIADGAEDVRVEINRKKGEGISVQTHSAVLQEFSQSDQGDPL